MAKQSNELINKVKEDVKAYEKTLKESARQLNIVEQKEVINENVKNLLKESEEVEDDVKLEETEEISMEKEENTDEEETVEEGTAMIQSFTEKNKAPQRDTIKRKMNESEEGSEEGDEEMEDLTEFEDADLTETFQNMSDDDEVIVDESEDEELSEEELNEMISEFEKEIGESEEKEQLEEKGNCYEELEMSDIENLESEVTDSSEGSEGEDDSETIEVAATGSTVDEGDYSKMSDDEIVEMIVSEMADDDVSELEAMDNKEDVSEGELDIEQDGDETVITHKNENEDVDIEAILDENKKLQKENAELTADNKKLFESLTKFGEVYKQHKLYTENIVLINQLITENVVTEKQKETIINKFEEVKTLEEGKKLFGLLDKKIKDINTKKLVENKLNKKIINDDKNNTTIVESKVSNFEHIISKF